LHHQNSTDEIISYSENHKVVVQQLDLGNFASIRQFAARVNDTEQRIDILIHNAGYCGRFKKAATSENIEMTMGVNVYGPFLLTHLLIDLLKRSAPAKIVVITSKAHTVSFLNPNRPGLLNPINFWLPTCLYANSKFGQFLLCYEMARRLQGTGVSGEIFFLLSFLLKEL
jgi:retinol dehydrogenase-14